MAGLIMMALVITPFIFVAYWVGRGYNLNDALASWHVVNEARENGASEDALVNIRTGEVLEPGTRAYSRAAKSSVRFE